MTEYGELVYMKFRGRSPTIVYLMDNDHDVVSKKGIKIPDDEIITDIQIRPNSITIIAIKIVDWDKQETITKIHRYEREIKGFKEVIPN